MSDRLRVYISGPITLGDQRENVRLAMGVAHELINCGYAPLCPHLSWFYPFANDVPHATWIAADLPWVEVSDAVLRLPGESKGADEEVAFAELCGIPVFTSIGNLVAWDTLAREVFNG